MTTNVDDEVDNDAIITTTVEVGDDIIDMMNIRGLKTRQAQVFLSIFITFLYILLYYL